MKRRVLEILLNHNQLKSVAEASSMQQEKKFNIIGSAHNIKENK